MKLVVGLGNPGKEYVNTRHNVGFMFLDSLYSDFKLNKKFNSLECLIGDTIIIKPLSYMNLSGNVVYKYVNFYKIELDDILIIHDDMDIICGDYKVSYNHGDGGHNGIKDIILKLNSKKFMRLKIGISHVSGGEKKDYVLGRFSNDELDSIIGVFDKLSNVIDDYFSCDRNMFMTRYNTK